MMKSAKVSSQLLLRGSADPYVSEAKVLPKSGNWSASEVAEQAEKKLNFKQILGYHQCHRAGFGSISIPGVPHKHSYTYRKLLTLMVEEAEEEKYQAKTVQGQWEKWCSYVRMDLSWKTLLVQCTIHCHPLLICIAGILTQRHHVYFAKNKFVLLLMFLEPVPWPCNSATLYFFMILF